MRKQRVQQGIRRLIQPFGFRSHQIPFLSRSRYVLGL